MVVLSQEQKDACNSVYHSRDGTIIAVEAIAGSGKSHMLKALDTAITGRRLYTCISKPLIEEAKHIFSPEVDVRTFHSFCYDVVVRQGLGGNYTGPRYIGTFTFRNVTLDLLDDDRLLVVSLMEEFFGSRYTSILKFLEYKETPNEVGRYVIHYIKEMVDKYRPVTFGFIVKWYHILLHRRQFTIGTYDVIYLDECQDMEACGLEIFKLLPSKRKVMVGDKNQMIFSSFTHAVNGFIHLKNEVTKTFSLTTSYRVNVADAILVERFMQKHIDGNLVFKGHDHHDNTIRTTGYIARTNSAVIAKMLELDVEGIEYGLARKVGNLFSLIMTLISLKKGNIIEGEYSFLNLDVKTFFNSKELQAGSTPFKYVMRVHAGDPNIKSACSLIAKYGSKRLYALHKKAKAFEKSKVKPNLIIGNVHNFKGLTVDQTYLDPTINLDYLRDEKLTEQEKLESSYILYVAVTRHRLKLHGAEWLKTI